MNKNWDKGKKERLKIVYSNLSKDEVLNEFPEYSWRYLQNLASSWGIKRFTNGKRNGKINKLFNDSNESYYWLGLIITDGYISRDGELKVSLSIKDYDYLNNLALFLETKISKFPPYGKDKGGGSCRIKIKDINDGVKLRELLKITGKKSYNPVNIDFVKSKKSLISLLGGYIDGDGSISKKGKIQIHAHINYYNFMVKFGDRLKVFDIITKFSVTTHKDMCSLNITTYDSLSIKKELNNLGLPIMSRKWDRVSDIKKVKNYLIEHQDKIIKMRKSGKTYKEICKEINYKSVGTLCEFINNII